jgi:hypothetical protein
LETYQVGVTKFGEFRKDAGLVLVKRPVDIGPQHSYLFPHSDPPAGESPRVYTTYAAPKTGLWKIVEEGEEVHLSNGKFSNRWSFVVGDAGGPICVLRFTDGTLTELRPVR